MLRWGAGWTNQGRLNKSVAGIAWVNWVLKLLCFVGFLMVCNDVYAIQPKLLVNNKAPLPSREFP